MEADKKDINQKPASQYLHGTLGSTVSPFSVTQNTSNKLPQNFKNFIEWN